MKLPGKGYPWKKFLVDLKNEYAKDAIGDYAGSMTFNAVLSLFPFLLFLVALASKIIKPQQVDDIVRQASRVLPHDAAALIGDRIHSLMQNQSAGILSIGAVVALWSASSGVTAVMRALNVTYDVEESRPFWKVRGIALLFTIGGGVVAIAAALAMIALPAIAHHFPGPVQTAIILLRIPIAALLMMFVWALAYYALPDVEQKFKFITPGSVLGVIIWLIASLGFSLYVQNFGKYEATYGSLGGVIVTLLWMWISAQVLLIGAEINSVIEHASPEGKNEGEKTLKGAEARTNGEVESKYGAGAGKKPTPRHLRTNRHPDGTVTRTPDDARESHPWTSRFSPSQHTLSQRHAQDWRPVPASRRPKKKSTIARIAYAAWGAFIGLTFIRARRTA